MTRQVLIRIALVSPGLVHALVGRPGAASVELLGWGSHGGGDVVAEVSSTGTAMMSAAAVGRMCRASLENLVAGVSEDVSLLPNCSCALEDEDDTAALALAIRSLSSPHFAQWKESKLSFIHIPKNAGTSVELTGLRNGIRWGKYAITDSGHRNSKCSPWHVPPERLGEPEQYADKETFCIVRHPYERAVSEYKDMMKCLNSGFWPAGRKGRLPASVPRCSKKGLNLFLSTVLDLTVENPEINDCHFLPQAAYVWAHRHELGMTRQTCKHVFRMDKLQGSGADTLEQFMGIHGVSANLDAGNRGACPHLGVADLTPATKHNLYVKYIDDFNLLGFRP